MIDKGAVYRAVRDAIKRGRLVRPAKCERCGATPPPAQDGRSQIQGHHHDYSKPLDVEWICQACHRIETTAAYGHRNAMRSRPELRLCGERNGFSRVTDDIARDIATKRIGQRAFARLYGLGRTTVKDIQAGRSWNHITGFARPKAPLEGEATAWRCDWADWRQYHDESDPLPEPWDDKPNSITPLYPPEAIAAAVAEARADEREQCAKVADEQALEGECPERAVYIADAIRARSAKKEPPNGIQT